MPVTDGAVSGRLATNSISTNLDKIDRSQNIQRRPVRYARTPRRDPELGAVVTLEFFSISKLETEAQLSLLKG